MPARILPFIDGYSFDPDHLQAMGKAFDQAAKALHDKGQIDVVREIMAKRIIEIAKTGERDPVKICARVLQAFGLPHDQGSGPPQAA